MIPRASGISALHGPQAKHAQTHEPAGSSTPAPDDGALSGPSMDALLRALPARATASGAQRRHVGTLPLHAALPFQLPQPPGISSPVQENPVAPHAEDHEDASDALDFQVIADDGPAALKAAQRTAFIAWAVEQARSSRDLRAMVRMAEAAASQAAALQCLLDPADVGHVLEGYRVPPEFQKMHRRMLDAAAAWRAAGEQYGAAQAIFPSFTPRPTRAMRESRLPRQRARVRNASSLPAIKCSGRRGDPTSRPC